MASDPHALPEGYGGVHVGRPADSGAPWSIDRFREGAQATAPAWDATGREAAAAPPSAPRRPWKRRWAARLLAALLFVLILLVAWLAVFAPVSQSARPIVPRQVTLAASDGSPIARIGATVDRPVTIATLPPHVVHAFLATEDRRFYRHWGIDPLGLARAVWTNVRAGAARQGGSTITQQLAKISYLDGDRTIARKLQELPIALWLELWLSKDEILERYLSNAYFGDGVYGLRAASLHYFYRRPERLTLTQAAMLAGLVKAPSRLAPTRNLKGAQEREKVVLGAMVDAGYLSAGEAAAVKLATVDHRPPPRLPRGSHFADWALPEVRAALPHGYEAMTVATTLDARLQRLAQRLVRRAPAGAEAALVAMRTDGSVVAMAGGKDYDASPFNRAVQARRQPGSTFKLVVYLAALQAGMTPDTLVDDSPIETGEYRPVNSGGRYAGTITLREAFARSSNVVAVRLYQQLGSDAVARAARDLGIASELPANASVALGSAAVPLLDLTAAYAAIAAGETPIAPHALPREETSWFGRWFDDRSSLNPLVRRRLLDLLAAAVTEGTGRGARLGIPAFGKTGTSQDGRDALFIGFAGDLVVGVWIGRDDNAPLKGRAASGGGTAASMWRDFMTGAIPGSAPRPSPPRRRQVPIIPDLPAMPDIPIVIEPPRLRLDPEAGLGIEADVGGANVRIGGDGVEVTPGEALRGRIERIEREAEALARNAQRVADEGAAELAPPP